MTDLQKKLFELQDEEYKNFNSKLIPTIEKENVIGIRVPVLRKFAKEFFKTSECEKFLNEIPHKYHDENLLHGMILAQYKDYEICIQQTEKFLPFIDNWAVCDSTIPKALLKNKEDLLKRVKIWINSEHIYTCRFAIGVLMRFFLDEDFKTEYLNIVANVKSDEYYVNMMISWYLATALCKQWNSTIKILENKNTSDWVHNKTIQKACESFRITPEQKEYLKTLKIK